MSIGSISDYFNQTNALASRMSPPPPPPPGQGGQGLTFSEVLSKMDTDGSGTLSADELSISEEAFALADSDGDGEVSQEEFENGGSQAIGDYLRSQESQLAGTAGQGPSFDDLLSELDADGNGTLNIDELDISSEVFAEADSDGDGEVSQEEFENGGAQVIGDYLRSQGPQPSGTADLEPSFDDLLSRLDADGNGTLNIDELNVSSEVFAEVDIDGDGEVSQEEFENGAQAIGDYFRSQGPMSPPGGTAPVETAGASSDSGDSISGTQAGTSDFLNKIAMYLNNMQFGSSSENTFPVNAIGRGLHRIA